MNTKKEKEINMLNKEFIRFLKDIGLYSVYTSDKGNCWKDCYLFSEFINHSFCWADTKHENLWRTVFITSTMAEVHLNLNKNNINDDDKYINHFKDKLF